MSDNDVNFVDKTDFDLSEFNDLGKYWAAVRGETVVKLISMDVPHNTNFEKFREAAIATLEAVGNLKTGNLYSKDGSLYFLPRPGKHQNRSKRTRVAPKLYDVRLKESALYGASQAS